MFIPCVTLVSVSNKNVFGEGGRGGGGGREGFYRFIDSSLGGFASQSLSLH